MMLEAQIKSGQITGAMSFNQRVWAVCARIPKGQVATYADVARALGTQAYRAVGNALNHNPYSPDVPCHRVVGSDGSLTGFAGGVEEKRRMLADEGIPFVNGKVDLRCRCTLPATQSRKDRPRPAELGLLPFAATRVSQEPASTGR